MYVPFDHLKALAALELNPATVPLSLMARATEVGAGSVEAISTIVPLAEAVAMANATTETAAASRHSRRCPPLAGLAVAKHCSPRRALPASKVSPASTKPALRSVSMRQASIQTSQKTAETGTARPPSAHLGPPARGVVAAPMQRRRRSEGRIALH